MNHRRLVRPQNTELSVALSYWLYEMSEEEGRVQDVEGRALPFSAVHRGGETLGYWPTLRSGFWGCTVLQSGRIKRLPVTCQLTDGVKFIEYYITCAVWFNKIDLLNKLLYFENELYRMDFSRWKGFHIYIFVICLTYARTHSRCIV